MATASSGPSVLNEFESDEEITQQLAISKIEENFTDTMSCRLDLIHESLLLSLGSRSFSLTLTLSPFTLHLDLLGRINVACL